ncbi:AAA family ATPase [Flavobacterium nitratireducens]|uniref:AAA family ATPase n=1 Tax=Flavobacterium nitratireducens TaxID=992289 RepID=UPI0024155B65|nr:AAA family ATPase [Flavobacterium nitratireducens]
MKLQKATRHQVKLRIGLSGPSGFGKTYSALLLAYGMTNDWKKIAIIDTENNSASLYSHLGDFNVLTLEEPFSPERYIKAIQVCEEADMEVIIIDSISHEWQSKGGCLEIHEQLGGRFQDWAKVTPRHNAFIDAIILSKCHIITTSRRKSRL